MLTHRVIPCLLLKNGGVVKTERFKKPKYIGDPINAVRIFNEKEVDELLILDIEASKRKREPDYQLIEQISGECFMPLAYGGGVHSVEQARRLFALGIEKICIQTAALQDTLLITQLAQQFGSQAVIVSVDVKKNWVGRFCLYAAASERKLNEDWRDYMIRVIRAGAGELILNAVDRDGTMSGMELALIRAASEVASIPLVAMGGVGSLTHMKEAVNAGANAVAVGSFFVFHGPHRAVLMTYPNYTELTHLLDHQI